ncbi:MAG TPA: hypothetical protein VKS44_05280 [Candidatus Acidoferrales bacterium]|nr:hypothetical protein [Candidatus Acidoferrales bacterium]
MDLFAQDKALGVTIIASNKSGGVKDSWSAHVNDWEDLGIAAKADKVLLVVTGKDLSLEDRQYAAQKRMSIWGEKELSYYEALVGSIKQYAKYEIIHYLGLSTKEEQNVHRVLALKLRQPTPSSANDLFVFSMPAEHLLKTAVIFRRAQGDPNAYQRMLRRDRLPKVLKFIAGPDAILPTNIIVHLSEKVGIDEVSLAQLKDQEGRPVGLSRAHDKLLHNPP